VLNEVRAEAAAGAEERERLAGELAESQHLLADARERLAASEAEAEERARTVALLEAERDRLATRFDEAQADLGETRERLAAAEEAAATCDGALAEVERLHVLLGRTHGTHAAEIAAAEEERERLVADVQASHEALREALERLAAAEVEASERARAATELEAERDRLAHELHDADRTLRKTRKRLAAATRVTEARDRARVEVERLRAVVDAWQEWAARAPVVGQTPNGAVVDAGEVAAEADAEEREPLEESPIVDGETGEYVLLVPTRSGYAFAQGTGPSPRADETIELVDPETGELSRFTVARVGRSPLPNGGTCVYLLQD
jgi:chromosome segregation ATPase